MGARLEAPAIRALLPHGPTMVLVDRVDAFEAGRSIVASKAVTLGERCYAHVESDRPTACYRYPTSLLLESFGQAAALLWLASAGPAGAEDALMLTVARDCHIDGGAMPGDVIRHEAWIEHAAARSVLVRGQSYVGARRIATIGSMMAVTHPRHELAGARAPASSEPETPSGQEVPA